MTSTAMMRVNSGGRSRGRRDAVCLAVARGAVAIAVVMATVASGCVSNEYRIPKDELWRLSELPVESRGQRVRVIQNLGQRRDEAVNPDDDAMGGGPPPPSPEESGRLGPDVIVGVDGWGGPGPGPGPGRDRALVDRPIHRGRAPGPSVAPPSGTVGVRTAPPVRGSAHGGGGAGGLHLGECCGGGGNGNGADMLVAVAVVVVGAALIATVGLAASEGARFDGFAAVAPDQYLYLKDAQGKVTESSLANLSAAQVAITTEATIMDDEGWGLRRLDHAPLDRKGGVFKLDLGTAAFDFGGARLVGPVANIQAGVFLTRHVGVLAEVGLSGGSDCCGATVVRHSLALEIDALPFNFRRLHGGVFAKGGTAVVGDVAHRGWGPLAGGGALIEVDLGSRLAFVVRGGANAAVVDGAWSTASTFTAGLAIY